MARIRGSLAGGLVLAWAGQAAAQAPPPPEPPRPAPYSLPWQLRGVVPATSVRNDLTFGSYEDPASMNKGFAGVESLFATYAFAPWVAVGVRFTAVGNDPPAPAPPAMAKAGMPAPAPVATPSGGSAANPVISVLFGFKAGDFRFAPAFALVLPIGMGGGDIVDAPSDAANKVGIRVRSAMDNAIFNPNHVSLAPGLGIAFVKAGFTVQGEATLIQAFRARGDSTTTPDAAITNFTMGLHLGYFIVPLLSLGAEIRHQRFLSTPAAVAKDELPTCAAGAVDTTTCNPSTYHPLGLRDTSTFAVGPRFHFRVGESGWIRPGVAYARGIDSPLSSAAYNMVQIDVPVSF